MFSKIVGKLIKPEDICPSANNVEKFGGDSERMTNDSIKSAIRITIRTT